MGSNLSLEVESEQPGAACDCCGIKSTTVHGFVYKSGDAFAVYYAGWSTQHPERGVSGCAPRVDGARAHDAARR